MSPVSNSQQLCMQWSFIGKIVTNICSLSQAFQQAAQAQGFAFTALPKATGKAARQQLQEAVGESEYFLAILPDGSSLVHCISREERHPLDFGRLVVAQLAGTPDK